MTQVAADDTAAAAEPATTTAPPAPSSSRAYAAVRTVLGLILIAAAVTKAHALATGPVEELGLIRSRALWVVLVELELALGLVLVAAVAIRTTRWVALACFGGFAVVALAEALAGKASCGCFGRLPVSPWVTLVIDIAAVIALLLVRPGEVTSAQGRGPLRAIVAIAALLAIGGPAGFMAARNAPVRLDDNEAALATAGNLVILEPEKWDGKPLPLFEHIDVGAQFRQGTWMLVFYHHDCSECRRTVPRLVEASRRFRDARLALVAVPPLAEPGHDLVEPAEQYVLGRLSNKREWFVQTPAVMLLEQGIIKAVGETPVLAQLAGAP